MTPENRNVGEKKINTPVKLVSIVKKSGNHFFDEDWMRHFDAILHETIIQRNGRVYFVTSEKFRGLYSPDKPRRYTVRMTDISQINLQEIGEFQEHKTLADAKNALLDYLDFLDASQTN